MKKKLICTLLTLIMSCTLLTGCGLFNLFNPNDNNPDYVSKQSLEGLYFDVSGAKGFAIGKLKGNATARTAAVTTSFGNAAALAEGDEEGDEVSLLKIGEDGKFYRVKLEKRYYINEETGTEEYTSEEVELELKLVSAKALGKFIFMMFNPRPYSSWGSYESAFGRRNTDYIICVMNADNGKIYALDDLRGKHEDEYNLWYDKSILLCGEGDDIYNGWNSSIKVVQLPYADSGSATDDEVFFGVSPQDDNEFWNTEIYKMSVGTDNKLKVKQVVTKGQIDYNFESHFVDIYGNLFLSKEYNRNYHGELYEWEESNNAYYCVKSTGNMEPLPTRPYRAYNGKAYFDDANGEQWVFNADGSKQKSDKRVSTVYFPAEAYAGSDGTSDYVYGKYGNPAMYEKRTILNLPAYEPNTGELSRNEEFDFDGEVVVRHGAYVFNADTKKWVLHNGISVKRYDSQIGVTAHGLISKIATESGGGKTITVTNGEYDFVFHDLEYSGEALEILKVGTKVYGGLSGEVKKNQNNDYILHFEILKNGISIDPEIFRNNRDLRIHDSQDYLYKITPDSNGGFEINMYMEVKDFKQAAVTGDSVYLLSQSKIESYALSNLNKNKDDIEEILFTSLYINSLGQICFEGTSFTMMQKVVGNITQDGTVDMSVNDIDFEILYIAPLN